MARRPDLHPTPEASAAFVRSVRGAGPGPGATIWSLGGSGLLVKAADVLVAVDPYLSNRLGDLDPDAPPGWRDRNRAAPVKPEDLRDLTAVLVTHGHGDHFDPATLGPLLAANPRAEVVLPRDLADDALAVGADPARLFHPVSDRVEERSGWSFEAIPAAHAPPEAPVLQPLDGGGHRQVGYLVEVGGVRIYHAGDTIVYDGLVERLQGRVDVAVLPVNGRRWAPFQPARRGNLGIEEAADLAAISGARILVPVHYELLGSTARPVGPLLEYAGRVHPELEVMVLPAGGRVEIVSSEPRAERQDPVRDVVRRSDGRREADRAE